MTPTPLPHISPVQHLLLENVYECKDWSTLLTKLIRMIRKIVFLYTKCIMFQLKLIINIFFSKIELMV